MTNGKIELSEDEKSILNEILWTIQENLEKQPEVTIVKKLTEKGADYILVLKEKQKTFYEDVRLFF